MEGLRSRPEWQKAQCVMMYAPLLDELDVWPLVTEALDQGRLVALPRYVPEKHRYQAARIRNATADIVAGFRGIREPSLACPDVSWKELDLILVPGRGFDLAGHRLGRGKGCYDQILGDVECESCGLAMDWQVFDAIPVSEHDRAVDHLLTPTRWVECAGQRAEPS